MRTVDFKCDAYQVDSTKRQVVTGGTRDAAQRSHRRTRTGRAARGGEGDPFGLQDFGSVVALRFGLSDTCNKRLLVRIVICFNL